MIRFIDLRQQDIDYQFAWWDTVTDRFVSFGGDEAWDTWAEFAAVCPIDEQPRYKRLCPQWVFCDGLDDDERNLIELFKAGSCITGDRKARRSAEIMYGEVGVRYYDSL